MGLLVLVVLMKDVATNGPTDGTPYENIRRKVLPRQDTG